MSAFSQTFEQNIINWVRSIAMPATPVSLLLALYNTDPLDDNTGTEVSGAGYSRQPITLSAPVSIVGTGSTTKNSGVIVFGPATGDWGSVTHWAIYDNTGAFLFHGAFLAAKFIQTGDSYTVPNETLEITVR